MTSPATSRVLELNARLVDIVADSGPYGPRYTWLFETIGQDSPGMLRTWTSRQLHPKSRAGAYMAAIHGRTPVPGERLDPVRLVGRSCVVRVEPNDTGYLVIKDVRPTEGKLSRSL